MGDGVLRDQTELFLPLQPALADHVEACIVFAFLARYVFRRRLQRPMRGREGKIGEEGLVRAVPAASCQLVDQVRCVGVGQIEAWIERGQKLAVRV